MKKLTSIQYNPGLFNTSMLLLRLIFGLLMMQAGYNKLVNFDAKKSEFMDFMHLGPVMSLSLTIFAEFFCSLFVILGLFTRISAFPVVFTMCVALFMAHHGDVFGDGSHAAMFLAVFMVIMLLGPGKISVDGMISK